MKKINLLEILDTLPPGGLSYQEWLSVGMALKEEGYAAADWEAWSAGDPKRYHPGECARKWESFAGSDKPVTAGTSVSLARARGWQPDDWQPVAEQPERQLITYLETLFEASETVGYVTRSYEKDGRFLPTKG